MRNIKGFVALAVMGTVLSGCYVVPIQPYPDSNVSTRNSPAVASVPLPRPVYAARL